MTSPDIFAVPAFNDNYIWVLHDGRHAVVVDPGQAEPVLAALAARHLSLSAILLTHHHADHVGGVAALLAHAGPAQQVPVYGPASEKIAHLTHRLRDADTVDCEVLDIRLKVLDVPGHTAGHIAYFLPASTTAPPRVFCGDTLFASGCGRLFEGTPAQMLTSLDHLATLPDQTLVHCAHEYTLSNIRFALACEPDNPHLPIWHDTASALRATGQPTVPTELAHERRCNPFLRADQPGIIAELTARTGIAPPDRLAAFTALRAWKDVF